jgi:hypothetical protein
MVTDAPEPRWSPRRILLLAALVVLPVVAFAPGLTSPLTHFDDPLYLERPELSMPGWSGLSVLWSGASAWKGEFVEFFPLRDTVYWLIFQQWQHWPLPYHLASLFFHVLATLLVFRLVEKIGQPFRVAATSALLFAVHPIHIESVVWVAGLKDPQYTCFMLGSLVMYCDYRERQTARSYALALGLLVCALLVKSMALSTPLIMLAMERWVGRPTPWKTIGQRLIGPVLVCATFLGQFVALGRLNDVRSTLHQDSWVAHVVLAAWAQVAYVRQAFFPSSFRLIYCFSPVESLADLRLLAGVGLLAVVGIAVYGWRRHSLRLFCLAFYFACLLPVSNLLPFSAVMADRYLYAASIATCLLVAVLLEPARRRLKNTILVLVIATFTLTTAFRSAVWQDEELLWQESDEDPVCLEDPEFPASFTHFLRYSTAKDDTTRLLALKRLLATRGVEGSGLRCDALLNGAQLGVAVGDHPLAQQWARLAVGSCASHRLLPQTVMLVALHRDLGVAEYAAEKWYRLEPRPESGLFRMLTRLEITNEVAHQLEILRIVRAAPQLTCPILEKWSEDVSAGLRSAVADALSVCRSESAPGAVDDP